MPGFGETLYKEDKTEVLHGEDRYQKIKAYDTVDWSFVEEMLEALDFPAHFRKLIMVCLTSTKYTLLLNGCSHGYFPAKRGLRQGDPLSPLLFVICMEYLSRTMKYVGTLPQFSFHPRCAGMTLNHLCFADNVLLFCKGDAQAIFCMIQGLKLFSDTSGLQASKEKTAIYCSGMEEGEVQRITAASGFSAGSLPFKYISRSSHQYKETKCC